MSFYCTYFTRNVYCPQKFFCKLTFLPPTHLPSKGNVEQFFHLISGKRTHVVSLHILFSYNLYVYCPQKFFSKLTSLPHLPCKGDVEQDYPLIYDKRAHINLLHMLFNYNLYIHVIYGVHKLIIINEIININN